MTKQECEQLLENTCALMLTLTVSINGIIFDERINIEAIGKTIKTSLGEINTKIANIIALTDVIQRVVTDENVESAVTTLANNTYLALNSVALDLNIFTAELCTLATDEKFFNVIDAFCEQYNIVYESAMSPLDDYVTFETREAFKAIENSQSGEDLV